MGAVCRTGAFAVSGLSRPPPPCTEFELAKEKILGEEPHHEYACMSPAVPHRSLSIQDMAKAGGGQSARVFGISMILDPILVVVFCSFVHTVLRKVLKRGCQ